MFLMREALATFNKNADGGVFIITSSIAGRIPVSLFFITFNLEG